MIRVNYKPLTAVLMIILPGIGLANGFQIWPQSGSAVGDLAAGAAASQTNVDTAYYNPASMSYFTEQIAGFSVDGLLQNYKFSGTETTSPTITNFSANTGTAQGGSGLTVLPTIMYIAPLSSTWAFGLSVSSPYRMDVNYGADSFVRYTATKQSYNTYDISPSLSYMVMPKLSFGLGFDALYAHEDFEQVVTNTSTANDSTSVNKASGWGFGWHTGMFWKATKSTNVGLSFRSPVTVNATGPSDLTGPLANLSGRIKNNVELPPMTILSIQQGIGNKWTVLGSAVYNQWNQMDKFSLKNVTTTAGNQTINLVDQLQNSWQFILGTHYQASPKVMLKGAVGYDQTPVKNNADSILFPNKDQVMAALGLHYQFATKFAADFGFAHYFQTQANVNQSQTNGAMTATATGDVDYSANIIGLELDWQMT